MVRVLLKDAYTSTDSMFPVDIEGERNISDLKNAIHAQYPGNPVCSDQRLIYHGRILLDNELICQSLGSSEVRLLSLLLGPFVPHVVSSSQNRRFSNLTLAFSFFAAISIRLSFIWH